MESPNLSQLAEKYWQGKSTEQEEQQLKHALLQEDVPTELEPLAAYLKSMQQVKEEQTLGADFDAEMMALLPAKKVSMRRFPLVFQIAASIVLVLGLGIGFQSLLEQPQAADPISAEFVDTFEDSELAYLEVKKALMLISSNMNEGMEHAERLGEFHKATTEVENRID